MDEKEASQAEFRSYAASLELPTVPVLYEGPYVPSAVVQLASGPSVLCPSQKVREGVVCRSDETRQVVKIINEDYELLQVKQEGTDYH